MKDFPRSVQAPPDFLYWYQALPDRIVDGDTVDLFINLGFDITFKQRIRLYGINAYELTDKDPAKRQLAVKGKEYVISKLPPDKAVMLMTIKDEQEKYGRYLGIIYYLSADDGGGGAWHNLNDELVAQGYAVPYFP